MNQIMSGLMVTLLVSLEQPQRRLPILAALHANIQDAFNEYGVQIMSPNYEMDPAAPKMVPREQWYAAPARAEDAPFHAGAAAGTPRPVDGDAPG
jgi:small-conductance mechanosensitive channel